MIDRKTKSPVDVARERIFAENQVNKTEEIDGDSPLFNEVTSFLDTRILHGNQASNYSPVLNFQLFGISDIERVVIADNTKLNFLFIFVNWPENGKIWEDTFSRVVKNKVSQIGSNSQKNLVNIHAFCLESDDKRKKRLVLDHIDDETAGIFLFDFSKPEYGEEIDTLEEIGDFKLNSNFQLSELQTCINDIKSNSEGNKGILLGMFSESIQRNIVADEFILREFVKNSEDCFSSIILPTAYFPSQYGNMFFELAGMIKSVVNLLSSSQDYQYSFYNAQKEIYARCIEQYSHREKIDENILASACSIYFAFEKQRIETDFSVLENDNIDYGEKPTTIRPLDEVITRVQENNQTFADSPCKDLERQIQNGLYTSLKSINVLTNKYPEYNKLLFSIVLSTGDHWTSNGRKELKNKENIIQMWRRFNEEEKPNIIGKQTYAPKTTEGMIMTAFQLSVKSIEQERPESANLIYDLIQEFEQGEGRDDILRAKESLQKLQDYVTSKDLSPHDRNAISPVNFILDSDIIKFLQVLYDQCKFITHLDEILGQAPIKDEYEFLFINSKEKNVIEKSRMKELCTHLKDAVSNRYPEGYSYGTTTPSYREHELAWFRRG